MKTFRLGLVRCDTHAYHFMCMVRKCDTDLLRQNDHVTYYYYLDIWSEGLIKKPKITGIELTKVWDEKRDVAKRFAETFLNKPRVCTTLEEVTHDIDAVFISDCAGDGSDHLKLATPFLKKGIPTFLDKPFASTLKDVKALVKLAEKTRTPLFSASSLSYVPIAEQFKQRFAEISPVGLGVVKGVSGSFSQENLGGRGLTFAGIENTLTYIIHGVALALNVFGKGIEWVEAMGTLPLEYMHLHHKSGMDTLVINASNAICSDEFGFHIEAYSKSGAIHSPSIGDPQYIPGATKIMKTFKRMIQTGKPPVPYCDYLEQIAIIEAGLLAQRKGRRVYLRDVLKQ